MDSIVTRRQRDTYRSKSYVQKASKRSIDIEVKKKKKKRENRRWDSSLCFLTVLVIPYDFIIWRTMEIVWRCAERSKILSCKLYILLITIAFTNLLLANSALSYDMLLLRCCCCVVVVAFLLLVLLLLLLLLTLTHSPRNSRTYTIVEQEATRTESFLEWCYYSYH